MIVKTGLIVTEEELIEDGWECLTHCTCGEYAWHKEGYYILHHRGDCKITVVPENKEGFNI